MKNNKILVVYKSITGFTKQYAEMIAQELDCTLLNFKGITVETMSNYDTVIFGGRLHAGMVDGLKKSKELFKQSKAKKLVVFATGATPQEAEDVINEVWNNNLTSTELIDIPHFYMQSGLCYENMSLPDKIMMKMFSAIMKKKKDKTEHEKEFEHAISCSYDISSKEYIFPLVNSLKSDNKENN